MCIFRALKPPSGKRDIPLRVHGQSEISNPAGQFTLRVSFPSDSCWHIFAHGRRLDVSGTGDGRQPDGKDLAVSQSFVTGSGTQRNDFEGSDLRRRIIWR